MKSATNDEEGDEHGQQTVLEAQGYRIIRSLGTGLYSTVKLAYSDYHQANVAVRIISKGRVPKDYVDKFVPREISIIKILKHPNIVRFLHVTKQQRRF